MDKRHALKEITAAQIAEGDPWGALSAQLAEDIHALGAFLGTRPDLSINIEEVRPPRIGRGTVQEAVEGFRAEMAAALNDDAAALAFISDLADLTDLAHLHLNMDQADAFAREMTSHHTGRDYVRFHQEQAERLYSLAQDLNEHQNAAQAATCLFAADNSVFRAHHFQHAIGIGDQLLAVPRTAFLLAEYGLEKLPASTDHIRAAAAAREVLEWASLTPDPPKWGEWPLTD